MSLMRVLWLLNWDLTDMTYTVTPGAIYSVLEPTPGVVNACLPTIKPAINRLLGVNTINWSKNTSRSGSKPGIRSSRDRKELQAMKKNRGHDFVQLEDHIPLTSIVVGRRPSGDFGHGNNITITRDWDIGSSYQGNTGRVLTVV